MLGKDMHRIGKNPDKDKVRRSNFSVKYETNRMGHIGSFFGGLSGKSKDDFGGGNARYVTFLSVLENSILDASHTEQVHIGPTESQNQVRKGDLLFNMTSETSEDLGMGAVMGEQIPNLYLNSFCLGFRIRNTNKHDPLYLAYYFRGPTWRKLMNTMAQGVTRFNLSKGRLSALEISTPSLYEQRAIAEALSDVGRLLEALDALIAKKKAIKQAAMQQLLTGRSRLAGFSGKWENKRLGEIGVISGAGVDKTTIANEVPVRLVNYLDVYHKAFLYSSDLTHEVSAKSDQVRQCMVEKGDIFFTPSSEVRDDIGRSTVAMETIPDGVYSYHVVRLRLKTKWDIRFRAYAFNTKDFLYQASAQCEGSGTRFVITLPKFRAMTVRIPPSVAEQSAIATILSDLDVEIVALDRRRDKVRCIKHGMMQQLLTGRVRLIEAEGTERG